MAPGNAFLAVNSHTVKSILTLFFLSFYLLAGAQTFRAAPIIGFNMAQIDGDNLAGYHKMGFHGGAKVFAHINQNFSLGFEILYSEKGSRRNRRIYFQGEAFEVKLSYVEIPLLIHYMDRNGMAFGAGLSYNTLLDTAGFTYGPNNPLNDPVAFKSWDINGIFDLLYLIKDHYGINLRYAYSLLPIGNYSYSEFKDGRISNNLLTFRFLYLF